MSGSHRLAELQRFLLDAIRHPDGLEAGLAEHPELEIDEVILPSSRQSPRERLAIYRRMHEARFEDLLARAHPRLRGLVGATRFRELALGFVSAQPSRSPELADFEAGFPDWLRKHRKRLDLETEIIELAELERQLADGGSAQD